MPEKADITENKPRLYAIEFLRVFFIFFIILGHIMQIYPEVDKAVLSFFHTIATQTYFGVEFFFIIGGFFLYKRILSAPDAFELIKKIYIRLLPALLFVFLLNVICETNKIRNFPLILTLTTGLSLPGEITGWGDWYVGAYFWCSLLFIGLFGIGIKQGFVWTAVLCYFTLCLKFNAPDEGWMKTYYTIIGNQFIRGVYSMGIGIFAAFLADKVSLPKTKYIRLLFSVFEAHCLIQIFNYIACSLHNHLNFFEMEIVFAMLLICIANSLGYISEFLNKCNKIQLVSRYSYSIFLGHIPFIKYLTAHPELGLSPAVCGLIIMGGGIVTGILEYHVIEKKVVPWIINYCEKEAV